MLKNENSLLQVKPTHVPVLDPDFRPAVLGNRNFIYAVTSSGSGVPIGISIERADGMVSSFETQVFPDTYPLAQNNFVYIDRIVKFLLWQKGGWKISFAGSTTLGNYLKETYSPLGLRHFDVTFMSGVYEKPFTVEITSLDKLPATTEKTVPLGRHLDGYRIGFDLGASDRKVAALDNGKVVFSEEVVWHPRNQSDPKYHYTQIGDGLKKAAQHLPRVDAIGGSSAGIYINNRVMVASLFRGIPTDVFNQSIKNMFIQMRQDWDGIPLVIVNDGEVTALAGSMDLNANAILGIALGSSEAAGYVTPEGNITSWLNELAFAPIDYNPAAPVDEWSGDYGCGVQYFSQVAVIRLAVRAGIEIDETLTPAEKLKYIQTLVDKGDDLAEKIFRTIGTYLGYTIAHYAQFYEINHILILGRVTSGTGGNIIFRQAKEVVNSEFPELVTKIKIHLPDSESSRRVGQAVAAASLPVLSNK